MSMQTNTNLRKALEEAGFKKMEVAEIRRKYYDYTGYPEPKKRYFLSFRSENYSIEEMYFWMLGHGMNDWSMPYVHKITDIHAASQGSSMFGDLGSRMTAMQSQASNFLATFGQLSKDLFKHVRDFRKVRERLAYYRKADENLSLNDRKKKSAVAAENTLKDIWINLIEGGGENPGSVYGMARKVGFTILPDLFFQAPPLKENEIKKYVADLQTGNPTVRIALERKLYQYYHWKSQTWEELRFREKYQKKLIYHHYQNMRMYLHWAKPYLKNSQALSQNESLSDSYGVISTFETSMAEIEVLLQKPIKEIKFKSKDKRIKNESEVVNEVIILHFLLQTSPEMSFRAKDSWQQKGPSHVGRVDATIRAYGWTNKEIENYKKVKIKEEISIMRSINNLLSDEDDLLGEDLQQILNEVEEEMGEKPKVKEEPEKQTMAQKLKERDKKLKNAKSKLSSDLPFGSVFSGLQELFIDPLLNNSKENEYKSYNSSIDATKSKAAGSAAFVAWQIYKNYKKAHKMITW